MATGKTGFFELSGGYGVTVRVEWSDIYDTATNKSVVSIDNLQVKSEWYKGITYFINGTIKVEGVTLIEFRSTSGSHSVYLPALNTYANVAANSGSYASAPWKSGNITHDSDGSKSVTISVDVQGFTSSGEYGSGWRAVGSQTVALTTIPRASDITYVSAVTLGNACSVKWTPKVAAFRYRLKFSMGDWRYTTGAIHPNRDSEYTYSGYTIPLEVAAQIPNARTGTMKVELYTYSDSGATVQVGGASSATFTVTVPDNDSTKPAVTMTLAPVSSLAAKFAGLYIQGKTKVKATMSATGKYGAAIQGYSMKAEGGTYDSDDSYTSGYLNTAGNVSVYGYAKDSRGITGSKQQNITVIGYTGPKILAASGESGVVAARCDANGNLSDSGTYLKIKAKRSYSPVTSGGEQKNFCQIRFRYKSESAPSYTEWTTILEGSNLSGDEIVTGALLGGALFATSSYMVQVQAVDDIGESATTTVQVMTETVYWHRTKNALGLGKYVEGENLLDVAWDTHLRGEVRIGLSGMTLKEYILAVISEGG